MELTRARRSLPGALCRRGDWMIEDLIRRVVEAVPPASGDDLTGFIIDAEHYFGSCRAFSSVDVEKASDRLSIVRVRARINDDVASVQDISQALVNTLPLVAYNHFSARSVEWYREATVLRFVTVPSRGTYCVTGTVLATGPNYSDLLARFERDFSTIHGPVRSWQGPQ